MGRSVIRRRRTRPVARLAVLLVLLAVIPGRAAPVRAAAAEIVISQVYGGGGNAGATYKNDFIELFNRGTTAVDLSGWSVQYAAAGGSNWQKTNLSGTIQPGSYYLVQEAAGSGGTVSLPAPDASGSINMSSSSGKVAVVTDQALLSCGAATNDCFPDPAIRDFVGYGSAANNYEGSGPTATLSNTTAALRGGGGCTETDDNAADFTAGAPGPRNSSSPAAGCSLPGPDTAPAVAATVPADGGRIGVDEPLSVTFSEPVSVSGDWYSIGCSSSGPHGAAVSGGPTTFTLTPDSPFAPDESCAVTIYAAGVSDADTLDPPDRMAADYRFGFAAVAVTPIHAIQGAGHRSPLAGQHVDCVPGIVTARQSNGFYMQDPSPDGDDATSEGIFVFTGGAPPVSVGDAVAVAGQVSEFFGTGASAATNLPVTEITGPSVRVRSSGNPLPPPVLIGPGGRMPPTSVIEDDAVGGDLVSGSSTFDPAADGIDFWESLEGMRVEIDNAVAVGPTNQYGEVPVLAAGGAGAGPATARGGILATAADANPERIFLDDEVIRPAAMPVVDTGDRFPGPVIGILDYSFGNYKLEVTAVPSTLSGGLAKEVTAAPGPDQLAIATFNVQNLDPGDGAAKFDGLADLIVRNLKAPDLVAVEEVQDNNGTTDDGTVDASVTWNMLISAIRSAGGPTYQFRSIDPVNDQDGGEPGGNIRVGFLFRTDRGLGFVDRPGAGPLTADSVVTDATGVHLQYSPGRVDPTSGAWASSRKPLAGEFNWRGHRLFVIANHFNSKGGDQPLLGRYQPPERSSESQRHQQAAVLHDFVSSLLTADPDALVAVVGDMNDFEYSDAMTTLRGSILFDPILTLPEGERYTYDFEGNSQALDHIMLSSNLFNHGHFEYDIVHVNAEFAVQASDHDPQVIRLTLSSPTASAGGPYLVAEGGAVTLSGTGQSDLAGRLSYAWDLDNDGTFETPGQTVTFAAAGRDGPGTQPVALRVCLSDGACATATGSISISNAAPGVGALSGPSAPVMAGSSVSVSAAFRDPGTADTHTAGIDWGDGTVSAGTVSESGGAGTAGGSHSYAAAGLYTVRLTVTDDDGGSGQATLCCVIVQDPAAALTGGGWFDTPVGRVDFGVGASFRPGATAPAGQTEIHAPGISLRSTGYDWLVVSDRTAFVSGSGTVGGSGEFGFLVAITDGGDGGSADKVRIRIWNKVTQAVLFDSQPGDGADAAPARRLGGGNVTVAPLSAPGPSPGRPRTGRGG